ncbi:MAG: SGNH/GDSL hydrolase family protein [Clostridiales bacterium]|nr:SGNH/GDSL hydrolase family protein [Clostridiales bacterium]
MDIKDFFCRQDEKPLDRLVYDGGFCGIFRTIGCIGDSLSSGEFEATDESGNKTYHDYFDYSWGQYLARMAGCKVYNFSRGGMTAKEYCESFAEQNGFWSKDKACQAYIIALGVNDINHCELGSTADIDPSCRFNNKPGFAGYYAQIVQRLKEIQPDAKFFLMTIPRGERNGKDNPLADAHARLLYDLAELFDNCYVLDFRKYAPVYDDEFREHFYLGGHLNPCGYLLTARMTASYIDYIVRKYPEDFRQAGFIGTPHRYKE